MDSKHLVIIGGGPSGLRAAEVASGLGLEISLFEGKPSVGRKFLVAGRGGLNLTHSEKFDSFRKRYGGSFSEEFWTSLLSDFSNEDLRKWAEDLGIATFVGTSGRVFPSGKHAAPLLRAWIRSLKDRNVSLYSRSILREILPQDGRFLLTIQQIDGRKQVMADAVILAMGGASWPQTGSDGSWGPMLEGLGLRLKPFQPANCGWEYRWHPDILSQLEGHPLKNLSLSAGNQRVLGELLITRYGLEGGALYQLGQTLRSLEDPVISIDFKPDLPTGFLLDKLPASFCFFEQNFPRSWRLSKAATVLLGHALDCHPSPSRQTVASLVKDFRMSLKGPRPIAEAISSAGGVSADSLDESLMAKNSPGLFFAGEMLDWEAPTGGYLLQGCFATGTRAGREAAKYLLGNSSPPSIPC